MIRLISRSKSLEDLAPAAKNGDLDIEDRTFENAMSPAEKHRERTLDNLSGIEQKWSRCGSILLDKRTIGN